MTSCGVPVAFHRQSRAACAATVRAGLVSCTIPLPTPAQIPMMSVKPHGVVHFTVPYPCYQGRIAIQARCWAATKIFGVLSPTPICRHDIRLPQTPAFKARAKAASGLLHWGLESHGILRRVTPQERGKKSSLTAPNPSAVPPLVRERCGPWPGIRAPFANGVALGVDFANAWPNIDEATLRKSTDESPSRVNTRRFSAVVRRAVHSAARLPSGDSHQHAVAQGEKDEEPSLIFALLIMGRGSFAERSPDSTLFRSCAPP